MSKSREIVKDAVAQQKRHWVRITRACNNNCLFCLDRENQNGSIFSMEEIKLDLEKGLSQGNKRVVISGGDPTVHPQLAEIIRKAKQLGYAYVQIITNGRMLAYEKFATELKEAGLDEITLSLHSHIEKDFEEMTAIKGSFKQALAGLLNAQKQGFIVSVDIVINKINLKKLRETLQFYIKLGVSEFDLLYPIPFGSAWKNRERLFFSPKKAQKYLNRAFALSKNKDLFIWTNRLPAQYLEGFEDLIQSPAKIYDEVRGMDSQLMNFVKLEKKMLCKGERCGNCFMQNYCVTLEKLLKNKTLVGNESPLCVLSKKEKKKGKLPIFTLDKNFDLEKFTKFYIENKYFVKSLRCEKCKFDNTCEGAWIEDIRKQSFSILRPKI
ncbi:MAG: radical SAM protein [Candidatus Moranbacteria bacterium]|nr:radical SAM protein [Candidatus Moranbacteria bacterium]